MKKDTHDCLFFKYQKEFTKDIEGEQNIEK